MKGAAPIAIFDDTLRDPAPSSAGSSGGFALSGRAKLDCDDYACSLAGRTSRSGFRDGVRVDAVVQEVKATPDQAKAWKEGVFEATAVIQVTGVLRKVRCVQDCMWSECWKKDAGHWSYKGVVHGYQIINGEDAILEHAKTSVSVEEAMENLAPRDPPE